MVIGHLLRKLSFHFLFSYNLYSYDSCICRELLSFLLFHRVTVCVQISFYPVPLGIVRNFSGGTGMQHKTKCNLVSYVYV